MQEKEKIESLLDEGKKILDERPELKQMSIDAVFNELDNGTLEMIRNSRSAAAWIVVDSIQDMKINSLVEHLVSRASGLMTDQYVGYLLQKKYHINLELLILEAEKCGQYEKIVYYVLENLQYQEKYESDNLLPLLEMLDRHSNDNTYLRFLHCYSKHITNCKVIKNVADTICELKTQAQYDLMCKLKYFWYREDIKQANEQLGFYISQQGEQHKTLAIEFIDESLYYDIATFEQYFPQLKDISYESSKLWNQMIPVFIKYLQLKKPEELSESISKQLLRELKRIPSDTEKTKQVFINAFVRTENPSEHLNSIYQEIISRPFEEKNIPYNLIDIYYCEQVKNGTIDQCLQDLQNLFYVNDIYASYSSFFNGFSSTFSEMSKRSTDIMGYALKLIISSNIAQVFFGIGLFNQIGNFENYLSKPENKKTFFSDVQLIRLMKGLLYFTLESKIICHTAFQLLALSKDECTQYFQFCMEEVYANYPATLYKISSEYITTDNEKQNYLAELVRKEHEQFLTEQEKIRGVKDLQPSYEHQLIYRKALIIQNQKINEKINEQSIFRQLFSSRTMKYGVCNAHIVTFSKNQKQIKESGYQHITSEMEWPMIYAHNPVEYELKRIEYIEEVKNSAVDY